MTRELSKANDGINSAAYKEHLHVIKYVINSKSLGLKIEHTEYVLAIVTMLEMR